MFDLNYDIEADDANGDDSDNGYNTGFDDGTMMVLMTIDSDDCLILTVKRPPFSSPWVQSQGRCHLLVLEAPWAWEVS